MTKEQERCDHGFVESPTHGRYCLWCGVLERTTQLAKTTSLSERQHKTIQRMAKTILKLKKQIKEHSCVMKMGGHYEN